MLQSEYLHRLCILPERKPNLSEPEEVAVCQSGNFLIERNDDVTLSTCLCELFPRLTRMGKEELSWFNSTHSLMLSDSDTDEKERESGRGRESAS